MQTEKCVYQPNFFFFLKCVNFLSHLLTNYLFIYLSFYLFIFHLFMYFVFVYLSIYLMYLFYLFISCILYCYQNIFSRISSELATKSATSCPCVELSLYIFYSLIKKKKKRKKIVCDYVRIWIFFSALLCAKFKISSCLYWYQYFSHLL